jgi:hypothetical protein
MSLTPQFGSLLPSPTQEVLNSNYLQFNSGAAGAQNTDTFAQQYLPEIYEQEVERYGNRTLSGFLRMVGAEMPMTSDQVIWSEQNRLHISYDSYGIGADAAGANVITTAADQNVVVSVNDTVVFLNPVNGIEVKAIVTAVGALGAGGNFTAAGLNGAGLVANGFVAGATGVGVIPTLKVFVYGSAYTKGTTIGTGAGNSAARTSIEPVLTQFSNSPIIIRDQYTVSGSDMAQIGWVEVATEDGASGYLWYLKAESETRLRFEDYLEMSMVESEYNQIAAGVNAAAGLPGSEGLFAAIQTRSNVQVGFTAASGLNDFDAILKNLDTQGAIEENMLFLNRQTALDFDDMLAVISGS